MRDLFLFRNNAFVVNNSVWNCEHFWFILWNTASVHMDKQLRDLKRKQKKHFTTYLFYVL